jgi:CRISPR-associated protein Cmr2
MNNYLGITIGPIHNTILQARKTREFWMGSYFFSYTMKLILQEVLSYGEILAQDISKINENEQLHGAGIYSDRCYVKLDDSVIFSEEKYNQLVEKVLAGLYLLGIKDKECLKDYLQIYCTCLEIGDEENPIDVLNKKLDIMELQSSYRKNYIYAFKSKERTSGILPYKVNELQELYESAFDFTNKEDLSKYNKDGKEIYSFPSLIEITTKGLQRKHPDKYESEIKSLLLEELESDENKEKEIIDAIEKKFGEDFLMAHKYAVIVNADADNMGKLQIEVADKKDNDLLREYSKKINDFSRKAAKLITLFGGKPVYIGGDDLLFFSPVISYKINDDHVNIDHEQGPIEKSLFPKDSDTGNIFRLIQILDTQFHQEWDEWVKNHDLKHNLSLSYGLSITYYKYPLKESMELSGQLLKRAKEFQGKNAISIQVQTHSGKMDEIVLSKEKGKSFDILNRLLEELKDKDSIIHSVVQRLRNDELIIKEIGKTDKSFDAYFKNEYDTDRIKDPKKRSFITNTTAIFNEIFKEKEQEPDEAFKQLCTIYRLLNFLIHK